MSKFKKGDRVQTGPEKATGTILNTPDDHMFKGYDIVMDDKDLNNFKEPTPHAYRHDNEMTLIPTKGTEISLEDIQVGDTIVAFWNVNGMEIRRKGVVASSDSGGDTMTKDGGYITYSSHGTAQHIYLVDRPEPDTDHIPDGTYYVTSGHSSWWTVTVTNGKDSWTIRDTEKPVIVGRGFFAEVRAGTTSHTFHTTHPFPPAKGFDALDKTKTYFLKHKRTTSDYYLSFEDGEWVYGDSPHVRMYPAKQFEDRFTGGERSWEKPVEYVKKWSLDDVEDGFYSVGDYNTWQVQGNKWRKRCGDATLYSVWQDSESDNSWSYRVFHGETSFGIPKRREPTPQEKLEAEGHSINDVWFAPSSNYTQRINPETGDWEFNNGNGWSKFGTVDGFLSNVHKMTKLHL